MSAIVQWVKGMDRFSQSQFFRYNKGDNYQTITGGVLSVIIYGIFLYVFIVLTIDMAAESTLDNSYSLSHEKDPSLYNLVANPANNFMFAIRISQLKLSLNEKQYFDIALESISNDGDVKTLTDIPLQPCEESQWSGINSQISALYKSLSLSESLCPPTGLVIPLQGKYSSNIFKYTRVVVRPCSPDDQNPTKKCATQDEVDQIISDNKGLTLSFYFVNPLLNLGQKNYLGYYFEDSNYFMFDKSVGVTANLYFSEYEVTTDSSYLPWTQKKTQSGISVNEKALSQPFDSTNKAQYAKIYLRKGGVKNQTNRIYKKLQTIFSFIGGLFGLVISAFFLFSDYNKCAYEIQFGENIFNNNKGSSYGSEHFNFIVYIGYYIYTTLKGFGLALNWHAMKKYEECQQECAEQLDIGLLFKKIETLEHMSHVIFGDHHLCGFQMIPKPTVKEIKRNRMRYDLKTKIYKQLDDKAREIYIESDEYDKEWNKNLFRLTESMRQQRYPLDKPKKQDKLKIQTSDHYIKLQQTSEKGEVYSQKILEKIHRPQSLKKIMKHLINMPAEVEMVDVPIEQQNNVNNSDGIFNPLSSEQILRNKTIDDGQ